MGNVTEGMVDEMTLPPEKFIRAKGRVLVDGNDKEFLVKGMAFGNEVWGNPAQPTKTHHTEDSYRELSEAGFNSVRFYLNYGIFEDDSRPYQYKEAGWHWLDKNIYWARKYNIYLILNMHFPQGGFQSLGNGTDLWTKIDNRLRLVALWKEIARRYKNEPTIAAFDFVNEPVVPELSCENETLKQWQCLAQEIAYGIRQVDTNHLIIVERLNASKNMSTGNSNWNTNRNGNMNFFLINDPNVAYEFHVYVPFEVTHQNASWMEYLVGKFCSYPDEASGRNKALVEAEVEKYLKFGRDNNVPLYLGEFGAISDSFKENRGGERWVADMLDICMENKINFNYHTYHEPAFGLYANPANMMPTNLNEKLLAVFNEKLK